MAFPQIGLEAVLQIQDFERNATKYNRTLDQMNTRTKRTGDAIDKNTGKAANSAFDLVKGFREAAGGIDDASQESVASVGNLVSSFGELAAGAGIVAAGVGGAVAAIKGLLVAGEQAAVLEDLRRSYLSLAAASGVSAQQLIADLQEVTRGTVDTATLIKTANTALLAGGAQLGDDLPRLLGVAEKAARATGQSIDFVTETLVKGAVKGSPLLIDNAELYLDIGGAVDAYAESVGKSADELTRQERTIATTTAIIEQGEAAYSALGAASTAATDPFKQLTVQSNAFGTGLKTIVAPAAEFVANSLQGLITASKASFSVFAGGAAVVLNLGAVLRGETTVVDVFRERFDEVFQTLSTGIRPIEDTATGISAIGQAAEKSTDDVSELNDKLADLAAQRGERLAKIELQNARRDEDIAIQRARQLEDAERQLSRRREDTERENAKARAEIARDNAQRIADVEADVAKKQRDFVAESQRAREELERNHRENLFQINQSAQDTISEAARRNDAVAIAAALRQRQRELRDEQRNKQIEQSDLTRDLQVKQQKLDEDAALTLEKARQQAAQALADQQASEAQQEESLRLSLARQEEDRNLAWQRQNEDLVRARERQLEDLDTWYKSEQEKLKENLDTQTNIAVTGVEKAGVAIAQATTTAINTVASSTTGLSAEQQFQQRGNFLGSAVTPSTIGLSEEEQRRLRGSFLARAEGGVDVVNRPTKFLAGEAGPELAAFVPLRNNRLDIGGGLDVNVNGAGGMDTAAVQQVVWSAVLRLAENLRVTR